jgi:hypothetical protein
MTLIRSHGTLIVIAALAATRAACADDAPEAAAGAASATEAAPQPKIVEANKKASGHLVAAVATGKPGAPVQMRFDIASRPKLGEAFEVAVELSADAPNVGNLQVVFQATDGLEIRGGSEIAAAAPAVGQALAHKIVVQPLREGIFYISAVATADVNGVVEARSFAIPVIVGNAAPASANKPSGILGTDAKGEKISSLAASESGG